MICIPVRRALPAAVTCALVLGGFAAPAHAFTNPDISVIGDVRAEVATVDGETTEELRFNELELGFVGALNPYASAEAFLAIHGTESIEIEEAKFILDRYLPWGFGLMGGVSYLDFGQINQVHSHAYPFLDRPLMHEEFFSEDGARDVTARLDWVSPVPTLGATVGVVRGEVFQGGHEHDHEHGDEGDEGEEEEVPPELGLSGRVQIFADFTDDVSLQVGGSVLHGQHDPAEKAEVTWVDLDAKFQWQFGAYAALVVLAEGMAGRLDATEEMAEQEPVGWFAAADLRTGRRLNFGAFAEAATAREDAGERTRRYGAFAGWALMEETTLFRLLYRRTEADDLPAVDEVVLQALFALGPHRPHRY